MLLEPQSFLGLCEEWNKCHGAFYQVHSSDIHWNLHEQEFLSYEISHCAGVPILSAVANPVGVAHGIPAQTWWLSLYGFIPPGKEKEFILGLIGRAEAAGKKRLAFGADEFHFLPGLPLEEESSERLRQAMQELGFQGTEAVDFVGDLRSEPVQKLVFDSREKARSTQWTFRDVSTQQEFDELDAFLLQEFPGRWRREFHFWQQRADAARASWALLRAEDRVIGFARYAVRGRMPLGTSWTPGALRFPLEALKSTEWRAQDSSLGPIGMAASERGKGSGRILLGLTLGALSDANASRLCIDWTNAYNYYMPLGFEVARNYWNSWKNFP